MGHAAEDLMEEYPDIIIAFGESDEFSFLLRKSTTLYNRRQSKIVSTLTSLFTSCYVFHWSTYFPTTPLLYPPSFDGRIVLYPTEKHVRDYFAWRQADTHINNLYNTTFWSLVQQGGQTTTEAHATLRGTFSKDKHEILYSRFGINYNSLAARFRKGTVFFREQVDEGGGENETKPISSSNVALTIADETTDKDGGAPTQTDEKTQNKKSTKGKKIKNESNTLARSRIELMHCDIIKDEFWNARPGLLYL